MALGRMLLHLAFEVARKELSPELQSDRPSTNRWARHLQCGNVSAWQCLVGRPSYRGLDLSACPRAVAQRPQQFAPELVAAIMYTWLCMGKDRSPLLDAGSFSVNEAMHPERSDEGGSTLSINISVHVRMGDACDRVSMVARSPEQSHFVQGEGRSCLHPTVYVAVIQSAQLRFNVDRILLATDSDMAVEVFRREFGERLLHHNFSRRGFQVQSGFDPSKWIERRTDVTPEMVAGGLNDMRFLAGGQLFVGGMCSHFFIDTWLAASFHWGYFVPFISLDECSAPRYPSAMRGAPARLEILHAVSVVEMRPRQPTAPDSVRVRLLVRE